MCLQGLIDNILTPVQAMACREKVIACDKVPKFKHDTFGKRAFAVYGPLAWNCLPKEIRLCDEIEAFKRNLKTHLFVKFVNESTLAIWFWRIIVKRPRMLSAQFVALYKPCKPKPNLSLNKWLPTAILTKSLLPYGIPRPHYVKYELQSNFSRSNCELCITVLQVKKTDLARCQSKLKFHSSIAVNLLTEHAMFEWSLLKNLQCLYF